MRYTLAVQEIGGTNCLVLQQDAALGTISTIVLRGSTEGFLDDVERAVNDAINTYKALCRDARMLPGGGAPEIEVARQVRGGADRQAAGGPGGTKEGSEGVCWSSSAAGALRVNPQDGRREEGGRAPSGWCSTVHRTVVVECCLPAY